MIPTQQEFVDGCYTYYAENYIEPGNPEDGEWEDAHYPVPKCKGGKVTIPLLKQHHAIHNVIQSEEIQYPCIWGWEADYLEGEMLALCKKWHTEKSKIAARRSVSTRLENTTPEQRSEMTRKARQSYLDTSTPQQRSEAARKREANKTPEQRSEAARKREANKTPEQRLEISRNATRKRKEAAEARRLTIVPVQEVSTTP